MSFPKILCASIFIFYRTKFFVIGFVQHFMHIYRHSIASLIIKALKRLFHYSVLFLNWQIDERRRIFYWMVCYLHDLSTKILNLKFAKNILKLRMTHSLKNGEFQTFFFFTLWYCPIKGYMNMRFLFDSRNTKISEVYGCILIVLQSFCQIFKKCIGYFPSFIPIISQDN